MRFDDRKIQGNGWGVPVMFSGEVGSNKDQMGNRQKPYISEQFKATKKAIKEEKALHKKAGKAQTRADQIARRISAEKNFPLRKNGKNSRIIKKPKDLMEL